MLNIFVHVFIGHLMSSFEKCLFRSSTHFFFNWVDFFSDIELHKLLESAFLTSDYTMKLQSLRQYGTGTKTEINGTNRSMEQNRKLGDKPTHLHGTLPLTKEARIYSE